MSQYNILNYFLPGSLLCIVLKYLVGYNLLVGNEMENILICYFTGLFISRVGSLFVEPVLKNIGLLRFADYKDFIAAEANDRKVTALSETNNAFRSYVAVFLVALIARVIKMTGVDFANMKVDMPLVVISVLLLLAIFSYKKQTDYVRNRVNRNVK